MALYKEMLLTVKEKKARELIEGDLNFRLFDRIRNFDLTFIAALNLIKFTFKKIKIQLNFSLVRKNTEEGVCFFRFGHFLTAGFLAYGHEIYGIVHDGKYYGPGYFLKNLSGYLPFIYVEKETFIKLFHEPFNETWEKWWHELDFKAFEKLKDKKNEAEKIYLELRDDVIRKINESKGNPEQNLLNFFIIYLFSAVRKFHFIKKVLKNQWEEEKFKDSGISIDGFDSRLGIHLSKEGDQKYEKEIQHVFDKILDKPPAFVMLFSYFIEKFYNPKLKKSADDAEKIKVRKGLISNIFYFTNEIFYGIRELAKNIIEHSSNGRGVIIGRVLNRSDLPGLKTGMQIDEYLKGREETEFIDLIVLDDGDVGIIEKTIKNLNVLKTEFTGIPEVVIKFEKDIENLSKGNIVLPDFFNPGDIKLNYQQIRSALSLGLLIFSHHVLENNGCMMVSSPQPGEVNGLMLYENWDKRKDLKEIIPLGTFYNILFPKNLKQPPTPRSETVPFEMPSGESAFNKLFKLIRNCKDLPEETIDLENRLCFVDYQLGSELKKDDIKNITDIFKRCDKCPFKKTRKLLSIDLKEVSKFDPTDLFLFLAKIQMTKDVRSIIVHNAKDEMVEGIIKLFKIFKKVQFKIGSNDHFVLFYYRTKDQQVDYYYSFLLAGESWDDLSWINEKIAKTNLTEEILPKNRNDKSVCKPSLQFRRDYCLNPLFTSEGHLLPFDVLIKRSGLTLFERNVLSDLNKPASEKSSRSYKFEDAHMRLGSKIHLKDFFYARRIFQNSFYSLRFAYLVSQYIESNIHNWIKDQDAQTRQLTIVGYGLYSELLISNATRFLKGMHPDWEIDHALIDIDEEGIFIVLGGVKKDGEIKKGVILIIPISSTLSTSLKIEMRLRRKDPGLRVIGNPINIMIVGSGNLEDIVDNEGRVIDDTVGNFWRYLDVDKKLVTPTALDKQEKFFIYLSSKWYLPLECQLCLPENPVDEVVLFETDKISVTPSLIFELPPPKQPTPLSNNLHFGELEVKNRSEQKEAILTEDMLVYEHTSRGNNHYLYYVETTDFLKRNKKFIENWLLKVKEKLKKKPEIFESRVILIAPAHITNADFINLVNEIIFNDVATLLHYDQDEDYTSRT